MSSTKDGINDNACVTFRCQGSSISITTDWVLPIPIITPNAIVSYEFFTDVGDIQFSMVFVSLDNVEEILIHPERVESGIEAVSGSVELPDVGTLILMWDNSYSWFTNKILSYSVDIEQVRKL
jgi:hypothetical protein